MDAVQKSFIKKEFKAKIAKGIIVIILAIVIYFAFLIFIEYNDSGGQLPENYVTDVIDGDTFKIYSGETIRLICIDAPEIDTEEGEEAKAFLEFTILNREVIFEKDIDDKDVYNRLLRYAYLNDSETGRLIFVNRLMVKDGYAEVFRYGNNTKKCDEIDS